MKEDNRMPEPGTKEFNDAMSTIFGGALRNQTAVEWFYEILTTENWEYKTYEEQKEIFEKVKQMEKEQNIDFAKHCLNKAKDLDILTSFKNVEQYYKETYG